LIFKVTSVVIPLFYLLFMTGCDERGYIDIQDAATTDIVSADIIEDALLEDTATVDTSSGLPMTLPFEIERTDEGEPLTQEEIDNFTKKLMNFYKTIEFGKWVIRISHGVHESTGYPDYMFWWHDVDPIKKGNTVIWHHGPRGGAHNIMIPTSKVMGQMIAGYLLTGDEDMKYIADKYMKGLIATMKGMVYNRDDPLQFIMARNIITFNHSYTIEGNKKKEIDYKDWYNSYEGWNAHRFEYKENPFWGDIWVTNMRSKDDIPHIYRATAYIIMLEYLSKDEKILETAKEAHRYMAGFTKDIVDSGYYIRTKDKDGDVYIPAEDLASFVTYEFLDTNAECNAKLSSALIAYSDPLGLNCKKGGINAYEDIAVKQHYYNLEIVSNFHLDSALLCIIKRQDKFAKYLTSGIAERIDTYMAMKETDFASEPSFSADMAAYLFKASSQGIPLKNSEARLVHSEYNRAIENYLQWKYWDLWDEDIPDGQYEYEPRLKNDMLNMEDMFFVFEYCFSPYRAKNGASFVNCDIVKDPSKW